MILPKFEYHEPKSLEEACRLMGELGAAAKVLAGGTDLVVNLKRGLVAAEHLVSLSGIQSLTGVYDSKGILRIGSTMTVSELAADRCIMENFPALAAGASILGSPLIRNLATLGGNLVTARPAADLPPPLMAYGGRVVMSAGPSERYVALEDFFKGPGDTTLGREEILTGVVLNTPSPHSGAGYLKLGVRKAMEISIANAAAFLELGESDGTIAKARVVLGSVAPTPIRSHAAEKVLTGEKAGDGLFSEAAEASAGDSRPIDDHRASAGYRKEMVKVLVRRALKKALEQAVK